MLKKMMDMPAGITAVEAHGTVTREDYQTLVVPLLEQARIDGRRIRFLYRLGPEFSGFTPGAAWEDTKVGIHYLRLLEKCALVSNVDWVVKTARLAGMILPCPVRTFRLEEMNLAVEWLESSWAARNLEAELRADAGVLLVEPKGPLTREDFEYLASLADPWIERHEVRGLVIHALRFPGWQDLGSLVRHLQFVRDHHRKLERVAVAADGMLPEVIPQLASHFVRAEVRHFGYADLEEAVRWAGAAPKPAC